MASKKEPRIVNPIPDGPLRKQKELYRMFAEVWIRIQKRLMAESEVLSNEKETT